MIRFSARSESCFRIYVAVTEAKFGQKIEYLRCAKEGRIPGKKLRNFIGSKGITVQCNILRNPEVNGLAKIVRYY